MRPRTAGLGGAWAAIVALVLQGLLPIATLAAASAAPDLLAGVVICTSHPGDAAPLAPDPDKVVHAGCFVCCGHQPVATALPPAGPAVLVPLATGRAPAFADRDNAIRRFEIQKAQPRAPPSFA